MAKYMAMRIAAAPLMVSETVIFFRSMPSKAISKSRRVSIDMPTRPISPSASGSSESSPICVGRSKATLSPVWPLAIRYLKRWLVSAGLPKPAYCRLVHGCLRYISRWMPRVKGYWPGSPTISMPPLASTSAAVYSGLTSMPDSLNFGCSSALLVRSFMVFPSGCSRRSRQVSSRKEKCP